MEHSRFMQPTSWKAVSLVLMGIILGCGASAIRDVQAEQPFPASAAAKRWQQYCRQAGALEEMNGLVRASGDAGFELAGMSFTGREVFACFKRPA